jgi:N-acetylmuramoyl-L-alanine amidase CwlA
MKITWRGSPNKNDSSMRKPITTVVIHWFGVGTLESADNRFRSETGGASAHYGVSEDTIYQWVKEEEVAWHAGNWAMNQRSIGIEHDATTTKNASEKTYQTAGALLCDICKRNNIPLDRTHIIGHKEVVSTQCPGTLDINKLINIAKQSNIEDFVKMDIPSEIEEEFGLKDIKRYDKHWTYEDFIQDWVDMTDEVIKFNATIKSNRAEYEKQYSILETEINVLKSKLGAINGELELEAKEYLNLMKKYDTTVEKLAECTSLCQTKDVEITTLKEILESTQSDYALKEKVVELQKQILELQTKSFNDWLPTQTLETKFSFIWKILKGVF